MGIVNQFIVALSALCFLACQSNEDTSPSLNLEDTANHKQGGNGYAYDGGSGIPQNYDSNLEGIYVSKYECGVAFGQIDIRENVGDKSLIPYFGNICPEIYKNDNGLLSGMAAFISDLPLDPWGQSFLFSCFEDLQICVIGHQKHAYFRDDHRSLMQDRLKPELACRVISESEGATGLNQVAFFIFQDRDHGHYNILFENFSGLENLGLDEEQIHDLEKRQRTGDIELDFISSVHFANDSYGLEMKSNHRGELQVAGQTLRVRCWSSLID